MLTYVLTSMLTSPKEPKARSENSSRRQGTTRSSTHEKSHHFGDFFLAYYESGAVPSWRAVCSVHEQCTKSMRTNQERNEEILPQFFPNYIQISKLQSSVTPQNPQNNMGHGLIVLIILRLVYIYIYRYGFRVYIATI